MTVAFSVPAFLKRLAGCTVLALGLMVSCLFQGCYVKWTDEEGKEHHVGLPDTSIPGSPQESGCVLKIERGKSFYPPEPSTVDFESLDGRQRFSRYADFSAKLEVDKCYEWKRGLGDVTSLKMMTVSADTVREIRR